MQTVASVTRRPAAPAAGLHVALAASVCVARMGCGALDYRQQAQQMELRTGGMSVSTQVIPDSTQVDTFEQVRLGSGCVCLTDVLLDAVC